MTHKEFENIKEKYGHYASWAVWSEEGLTPKSNMCTAIFDNPSTLNLLHTDYVLVALNISRAIKKPLGNFHPDYTAAADYKTRYALKNTPLWGAYMTDIIKDFEEVVSGKMMKYLKENPEFEKKNIESFVKELNFIGAKNPTLVAIGNDSFNILERNFVNQFEIKKIPHYSNYSSKEKFREQVLELFC
ncbi:MAG: hypothetical protein DSZ27_04660 [Thiomicrospira sp.]|nr:MAG: hypothetical protein DSZ27_04660 [Thiomicrospira sp.]